MKKSDNLTIAMFLALLFFAFVSGSFWTAMLTTCAFTAWVSAANTVTVKHFNYHLLVASNPTSGTFKVVVWHF